MSWEATSPVEVLVCVGWFGVKIGYDLPSCRITLMSRKGMSLDDTDCSNLMCGSKLLHCS